ncbi:MAG: RagB/SusD family nutrient uptake outer membrane protein, partial [Bacteroidota bacterium]|nr:RagB/SusD family nutrient uptake outer membrane protein [Bacteroidota bacterium]
MKLKTIKISFIAVIALVSSCTDLDDTFYDRIPADTYPENDVQAALMTTPVYAPMRDFLDWGGWYFAQEVTSDEITVPTRDTDWDDGGKWRVLHTHQWNNNTAAIVNMWPRFYKGIFEANALIERTEPGLNSSDAGAVDAAKNLIAKMKIMRAYYYYLLIDNYGDVPFVTSFAGAPEMPYKEDRATIFDAIVEDVEVSISDLGVSNTKTGVSKGMAFSLLAKLYLNSEVYTGVEAWSEAEAACDSVIALGQYSLEGSPLAPFITENSTSPENIWVIPYDED